MKHLIIALLLGIISLEGQSQATWTQQTNFPAAGRYWCSGFAIGDNVYVGLGFNGSDTFLHDFWRYNTTTNTWTQRANYPGGGSLYVSSFVIGNKGYFACGYDSGYENDLWEYNPDNNTWTQMADVPGPGRWGAVGFSIGENGYIVTGDTQGNGQGNIASFYKWNQPTNTWEQLPDFPGTPVYGAAGFSIGNSGYIGTGYDGSSEHNEFYQWNEDTDTWTQMADFGGTPRYQDIGFAIGNKGYIGLGSTGSGDFWEYDPAQNTWTQQPSYPGSGVNVNASAANSTAGYVGLGQSVNQQWWKFTPLDCTGIFAEISADGDIAFCQGNSVELTATEGIGYTWSNGTTEQTAVADSTGLYEVTVHFENGCSYTNSIQIEVWDGPAVGAIANDLSLCMGDTLILNGTGAESYIWDGDITDGAPYVITENSPSNYIVEGTDANGCTNMYEIIISLHALPEVTVAPVDTVVCTGETVTLQGQGASSFVWDENIADNASFIPSATTTYHVTGTDNFGCENNAQITIVIHDLPEVSATASVTVVCAGDFITLTGSGAPDLQWSDGVQDGVAFQPNASMEYTLTGTDENDCSSQAMVSITVNPLPVVTFNLSEQDTLCVGNGPVTLNVGAPAGGIYTGSAVSNNAISTSAAGIFDVEYTYTDSNNCMASETASIVILVCDAVEELEAANIDIYPNPVGGSHQLTINSDQPLVHIQLMDVTGKMVLNQSATGHILQLYTHSFAPGEYMLLVTDTEKKIAKRVVVK